MIYIQSEKIQNQFQLHLFKYNAHFLVFANKWNKVIVFAGLNGKNLHIFFYIHVYGKKTVTL